MAGNVVSWATPRSRCGTGRDIELRKRGLCLLLAGCLACAPLAGCSGKDQVVNYQETDLPVTTITFFGNKYEPENVRVIEEIITGFMEENPNLRISYESLKGDEYFEALRKRMASGKGNDVFMVNHDVLLELEQSGQVADLSGLESIGRYSDAMLSQMEIEDNTVYWVPTTVSMFGLYCNLELLKKHKQEIPQNLGEWEQVCDYFVAQGITPIVANNDISLKTLAIGAGFYPVYQEGRQAEVFEGINSGRDALSDYLRPGFSLAGTLIDRGYVDAQTASKTRKTSDDLAEFARGEAPFMLTGAWAAGRLEEMAADLDFEVHPLPVLEDGSLLVINADTRLSVNRSSEHLDDAMKFVEYFTREENILKFADQQASLSPLKTSMPTSVKAIQPLIPCYEEGRVVFGADAGLDIPIWDLTAEVSRRLLSGQALNGAMDWMDQQAKEGVKP